MQSSSRSPHIQAEGNIASTNAAGPRTITESKGVTGRAQSSSIGLNRITSTDVQSKEAVQNVDIGFIPSCSEPDRQTRQKRY